MWTASSDFCKIDNIFLNITVGMEGQLPNCPIFLSKIQFYPFEWSTDNTIAEAHARTDLISLLLSPLCCCRLFFFLFFFFLSSSSSSSSSLLYFYFILFVLYIWSEKKYFEGKVFDQQNTKQHWSATKNHQVLSQILKYLLKNNF